MASNKKALLPETRFLVPVAGGDLAVYRYGPERGKPILAIHGITSSNRVWQCLAGSLVPHVFMRWICGVGAIPVCCRDPLE